MAQSACAKNLSFINLFIFCFFFTMDRGDKTDVLLSFFTSSTLFNFNCYLANLFIYFESSISAAATTATFSFFVLAGPNCHHLLSALDSLTSA